MKNFAAEYIDLLIYVAGQYPRYVCSNDIGHVISGEIRTRQRMLKSLSDAGYLEVIRSSPLSYRIRPDKFEAFGELAKKIRKR